MKEKRSILIIGTVASSFYGFRADLIRAMREKQYTVYAFTSEYSDADLKKIESLGAIPVTYELNRGGLNPLADIVATYKLAKKIKAINPDLVFSYFSKPVIFGTLAAKLAAVPRRIGMLEGLGYTFTDQPNGISSKAKLIRNIQILMLNIVYIITRSDVLGGASVHLLDLAKGMIRQGHQVHILVGGEGAFTEELKKNNINFSSLEYLKREISIKDDFLGFWEIKKHLKQLKPDIVHCHSSKAGLLGRLAAKSLNLPVVFTAHGWAFTDGVSPRKQKIYATLERFMTKFSDHIITVSEYDRQHGFTHYVGTPELVQTIHNGVPDIKTSASEKSSSIVRLIMVARFEDPKDQYFLIQALSKLPAHLTWQIDFLGDGPNLQKCQELANHENLDSKIIFHGQSFKVKEFLNLADIFVLISNYEGFPLTILEAMSTSLPIIASDVGGVKESVSSKNGYLIPKGDIDILVQSLQELIVDKNLRLQLGDNSRHLYETQFNFNTMLNKTLDVYTQVLSKRSLK